MKTAAAAAANSCEGERRTINSELWHACAGPLVTLPPVGSLVVYFPQGHSEQVAASMQKNIDAHVPNYPNLPSKLICLLHSVTLHADAETDEVYAQMTLQPVNTYDEKALLASDLALRPNKPQTEFFCKTLTASDTSTHGGFSVPRRAAEKIFPSLDFSMQPPAQELQARDLHDCVWTFRHIFRGQPKRHLLTTGWSLFVSGKRLFAGDSVLFIRDAKQELLLGIRRANKQPTNISSSVLSSDSMHIGILAAAAHAAANNSPFTIFYNPRASPSEFVVPLAKYQKALYSNQISLGMRFRMMFETEDSGTRRYMGTITGISDLDPVRWKNSQWRNLQVGWDESTAGERRNRLSIWEIEPVAAPFFICPPPYFRSKRPRQPGMLDDEASEMENLFKMTMPWLGEEICIKDAHSQNGVMPGLSLVQWMNMQHNPSLASPNMQPEYMRPFSGPMQSINAVDLSRKLGLQAQLLQQENIQQFNAPMLAQQIQQVDQLNQMGSVSRPQQQLANQSIPMSQNQPTLMQPQVLLQAQVQHQQPIMQNHTQIQTNIQNNHPQHQQQQQLQMQQQQQLQMQQQRMPVQVQNQATQQLQQSDHQIQMQLLRKLQQKQQSILPQSMQPFPQLPQSQEQQHRTTLEASQHLPNSCPIIQQQQVVPQQCAKANFSAVRLPQSSQQVLHGANLPATAANRLSTNGRSAITDDLPSCSTSPSTNNSVIFPQPMLNRSQSQHRSSFDALVENPNVIKEFTKSEHNVRHSTSIPNVQDQVVVNPQTYLNNNTAQLDYLDTSSSATSACLQNDGTLQQSLPFSSFNQPSMFRDAPPDSELHCTDPRNNVLFGVNIEDPLGLPLGTNPLLANTIDSGKYQNPISGNMVVDYSAVKDAQQELSSSIVSQSFGLPDMAFNSIDPAINESGFLNKSSWTPAPQIQRMRTYTKVYKRGAVGRSIDITRYAGYDELKHDLARMFSIEGQLEDRQKIGWKLVYVDHEGDVLLVGDDPWEEFVSCVRCIKILSPQEVQQLSLDGDLGNNLLPNQACSSSDGNAWKDHCDQNSGNPSSGPYDHLE